MSDLDLTGVLSAHKSGNLQEAEQGYLRILAADPQNGEAYHWLGVVACQKGAPDLALELMKAAQELRPNDPLLLNNLANVLSQLGQMEEAVRAFDGLLEIVFDFPEAHYNRALTLVKLQRLDEAAEGFRKVLTLRSHYADAHYQLARVLEKKGQGEEAARHLRCYLDLEPGDRFGAALRLATMGLGDMPERAAFGFVQALFDDYADGFDDHLKDRLDYSAPELIAQALLGYWQELPHRPAGVDIGCGTGLAGVPLRPRLGRLDGVDASPKMIAKARERGLYDDLAVVDLLDWTKSGSAEYHLVIAADVVVYFGILEPLFSGIVRRLVKGGLFVFTAERTQEDVFEQPMRLQGNFRYAHTLRYLQEVLSAGGLSVLALQEVSTRKEGDQPVPGVLAIARLER